MSKFATLFGFNLRFWHFIAVFPALLAWLYVTDSLGPWVMFTSSAIIAVGGFVYTSHRKLPFRGLPVTVSVLGLLSLAGVPYIFGHVMADELDYRVHKEERDALRAARHKTVQDQLAAEEAAKAERLKLANDKMDLDHLADGIVRGEASDRDAEHINQFQTLYATYVDKNFVKTGVADDVTINAARKQLGLKPVKKLTPKECFEDCDAKSYIAQLNSSNCKTAGTGDLCTRCRITNCQVKCGWCDPNPNTSRWCGGKEGLKRCNEFAAIWKY